MSWSSGLGGPAPEPPPSRVTFLIERAGPENVKLTLLHEDFQPGEMEAALRQGWPAILSSLKSFLETGQALDVTKRWVCAESPPPRPSRVLIDDKKMPEEMV